MNVDFILERQHGFYSCKPQTDRAREFTASRSKNWPVYEGKEFLLDSFFANAGDWCRQVLLPAGFSLQWGTKFYEGTEGIDELWEECA